MFGNRCHKWAARYVQRGVRIFFLCLACMSGPSLVASVELRLQLSNAQSFKLSSGLCGSKLVSFKMFIVDVVLVEFLTPLKRIISGHDPERC